jgi:RND family efflux transporter MFP subunit
VSIFTTVNGKISEVRVREGDAVRKGQVLALIDRDQAGLKFAPAEVTSTISGTVKDVLTEVGATVNPAAPLFQIADMDVVEVVVYVPEKKISRVRAGQEVEIKVVAYPERVFSGTVARLSPVVDPASRTLETRIRVVNRNHALKPGMFAEARIVLRQLDSAVTIPLAALVDKEGEQVAFVVNQDIVHEVRPVIAFVEGEKAVIEDGVEAGDQVVVIGQQSLSDGDEVAVAEEKE